MSIDVSPLFKYCNRWIEIDLIIQKEIEVSLILYENIPSIHTLQNTYRGQLYMIAEVNVNSGDKAK